LRLSNPFGGGRITRRLWSLNLLLPFYPDRLANPFALNPGLFNPGGWFGTHLSLGLAARRFRLVSAWLRLRLCLRSAAVIQAAILIRSALLYGSLIGPNVLSLVPDFEFLTLHLIRHTLNP
jgi:hypothetical protein